MNRNGTNELAITLAAINDSKIITEFFESLFTLKEIEDISSRWELVKLLDQGVTQREIAGRLGLSLCKITRGSKELKKQGSVFKRFIDEYYKQAQLEEKNED
ncbi:MAG: transcriptional regulator [Candidatus Aminicenantes bacterium]|nr:transcriptional regulator [Candidatus Aminicenantes bacterium]